MLMSMQMDACLKKERLCTLFVRVGAPEGGVWGRGGRSGGSSPKIGRAFLQKTIPCLLCTFIIITWMQDAFALSEPILVAIHLINNTLPSISHCISPDCFCVVCWSPELKFPYTLKQSITYLFFTRIMYIPFLTTSKNED